MDENIKNGCDVVFDFYSNYWLNETKGTAFDPIGGEFSKMPPEISALLQAAVQYGACKASGYFSKEPEKFTEEFSFYLTEKMNMPEGSAETVAQTVQQQENNPAVQKVILMGEDTFRKWLIRS